MCAKGKIIRREGRGKGCFYVATNERWEMVGGQRDKNASVSSDMISRSLGGVVSTKEGLGQT